MSPKLGGRLDLLIQNCFKVIIHNDVELADAKLAIQQYEGTKRLESWSRMHAQSKRMQEACTTIIGHIWKPATTNKYSNPGEKYCIVCLLSVGSEETG